MLVLLDALPPGVLRAVVAREDDQCVSRHSACFQRVHHASDVPVGFHHEVAIGAAAALAAKLLQRDDRQMRRGVGQVEKEGFAVGGFRASMDVFDGLVSETRQALGIHKIRSDFHQASRQLRLIGRHDAVVAGVHRIPGRRCR